MDLYFFIGKLKQVLMRLNRAITTHNLKKTIQLHMFLQCIFTLAINKGIETSYLIFLHVNIFFQRMTEICDDHLCAFLMPVLFKIELVSVLVVNLHTPITVFRFYLAFIRLKRFRLTIYWL